MGRYVYELLAQSRSDESISWLLYSQDASHPLTHPEHPRLSVDLFDQRGDRFRLWEQLGLPRRARDAQVDLLHCTEGSMNWWQPVPTVITLHDTLMWTEHEDDAASRFYWQTLMPAALKKAAAVITISECSRDDILARWPELAPKLTVIYHGIDPGYFGPATAGLPTKLSASLAGAPYITYLGGPLERKRFSWALEVLAAQPHADLKLVACGFGAEARQKAAAKVPAALQDRVIFADFLSEAELLALYKGTRAVLYPTLYEGFGFPAVEAQAAGAPVLFSPLGSLKELVGPLATVLPHDNLAAWAAAVDAAVKLAPEARAALAGQARGWTERFQWQASFAAHREVYQRIARRR
jgi:alpha-1,3-rhamnosyl/mannosyltransferase